MTSNPDIPRSLELLSPAKDVTTAIAAISCGADAIYIGPESFGARAKAANSLDDIRRLTDYALPYGVKVYATVNTIIYDNELAKAEKMITGLWRAGVDALIVQDPAVLTMDIPPIALHASTQCDIRDVSKTRLLAALGYERIVVARELSPADIARIHAAVPDTEIEAFVHGALCVSYSGDCHAGYVLTGRSANRGECPQICRLKYSLTDQNGREAAPPAHFLSLKDMNRLAMLDDMAAAGVCSFKIEGRLKDINYVRTVVSAYRRRLDKLIDASGGRYVRASYGKVTADPILQRADLGKVFNRGFTSYFFNGKGDGAARDTARIISPKWLGEDVGEVIAAERGRIRVKLLPGITLNNGDGLVAASNGRVTDGFRINRAEGEIVFPSQPVAVRPGDKLTRNSDNRYDQALEKAVSQRKVEIDMEFDITPDMKRASLTISDRHGHRTMTVRSVEASQARSGQADNRRSIAFKLGDTPFTGSDYRDNVPDLFIPNSVMTALRREAVSDFMASLKMTRRINLRKRADMEAAKSLMAGTKADYHHNIANNKSRELIESLGAEVTGPALEIAGKAPERSETVVMTCRYCLRRQLGACLRTPQRNRLPEILRLKSQGVDLRLDFDCERCVMKVIADRQ